MLAMADSLQSVIWRGIHGQSMKEGPRSSCVWTVGKNSLAKTIYSDTGKRSAHGGA